jgi:hypothetical protein
MKTIKYFACFLLLTFNSRIYSQDQSIFIFDPTSVSTSFQYTLSQLTEDSVFVADTLDDSIFNYDGLFLFINPPFALSQEEGNRLIQYTSDNKPAYLFTGIFPEGIDTVAFWNHIGIEEMYGLLLSVPIDTVFGVPGQFTSGVIIDTSFMSGLIPVVVGNVDSILIGDAEFWEVNTTYISGYDSLNVIIDLYNLIDDYGFLQRVLIQFGLIPSPPITVLSPNGGEHWMMWDTVQVEWSATGVDSVKIELSLSDGIDWMTIAESVPNTGTFDWFVQAPFTSWYCLMKISDLNDLSLFDISDANFTIDMFPAVEDSSGLFPDEFALMQNYPNPFNPSTVISYRLPVSGMVTLKVYDVLGNEIATLVNEEKQPGTYEVEFSPESSIKHSASEIYFYQLRAGNFIETKKMVFIK